MTPDPRDILAQRSEPAALSEVRFNRDAREIRRLERRKTFIVTSAQNNTKPDWDFWSALQLYARERDAELLVVPLRYKNPTSRRDPQEGHDDEYWWHEAFRDYLFEDRLRVHEHLTIMGDVRIQATAPNPLPSRLFGRSKGSSAIYGASQLAMQVVATPQSRLPKILYSTGSVTVPNYSRTLAGDLAEFHHSLAAIIVEVQNDRFYMREIVWDGELFYDFDRLYTPKRSRRAPPVLALYMGDTHTRWLDPGVREATFGDGGIVPTLRPPLIVQGDVLDGYSINPHERGRQLFEAWRAARGLDSLERELEELITYLKERTPPWAQTVVTPANHDDFLARWLQAGDKAVEPINRELYHRLSYECLREARETGEMPNPLEVYCRGRLNPNRVRFLKLDESFQVAGIELGMHGHLGPNGARGSARNLSLIGTRSVIGNAHSPCIYRGVYQVGTSSLYRLGYNAGPSSWLHTHCAIHHNGKRQMIHIIDDKWRGAR